VISLLLWRHHNALFFNSEQWNIALGWVLYSSSIIAKSSFFREMWLYFWKKSKYISKLNIGIARIYTFDCLFARPTFPVISVGLYRNYSNVTITILGIMDRLVFYFETQLYRAWILPHSWDETCPAGPNIKDCSLLSDSSNVTNRLYIALVAL
jgi:hypothetical protein